MLYIAAAAVDRQDRIAVTLSQSDNTYLRSICPLIVTYFCCDEAAVAFAAASVLRVCSCARFADADVDVELGREIGFVVVGGGICCSDSIFRV